MERSFDQKSGQPPLVPREDAAERGSRLAAIFADHYDFVWRCLRRFGLLPDQADDAAQEVFIIASRRLEDIEPAKERAFLFGCALRVAKDTRRAADRRPVPDSERVEALVDPGESADERTQRKQARETLDKVLGGLPEDLRVVFTLFELEEMTMVEIGQVLEIPQGTVASRLRRAREIFRERVERLGGRDD